LITNLNLIKYTKWDPHRLYLGVNIFYRIGLRVSYLAMFRNFCVVTIQTHSFTKFWSSPSFSLSHQSQSKRPKALEIEIILFLYYTPITKLDYISFFAKKIIFPRFRLVPLLCAPTIWRQTRNKKLHVLHVLALFMWCKEIICFMSMGKMILHVSECVFILLCFDWVDYICK
jgi:hypothetical protein